MKRITLLILSLFLFSVFVLAQQQAPVAEPTAEQRENLEKSLLAIQLQSLKEAYLRLEMNAKRLQQQIDDLLKKCGDPCQEPVTTDKK